MSQLNESVHTSNLKITSPYNAHTHTHTHIPKVCQNKEPSLTTNIRVV